MNRIADYALIGDCHSAALVGRDGSIDWACFPRFDSPAVFCRALDEERGGGFLLAPKGWEQVRRSYLEDTNVLVTTFTGPEGVLELTDCMPVKPLGGGDRTGVATYRSILRRAVLVPAFGLVPSDDPLVTRTIDAVQRQLGRDGLLYRYLTDDGLEGGEGAFLLCSFWLLDCLTHAGRLDEAGALLERLLGLANDVGLFAEEVDPATGEPLGNFPQAFSDMALVLSCANLSAAKRGELPVGARDYSELALDRLMARLNADEG